MKVKRTLNEICTNLVHLRDARDMYARLVAETLREGNQAAAESFMEKFKHFDEVINYLSEIEVEYEDKYEEDEPEEE